MTPQERKVMELALDALQDYVDEYGPWSDDNGAQYVLRVGKEALAQTEQETNKNGSPCPEFWDWLPKAYNFEGDGNFTKYNMEVAFLAGKQASQPEQAPVAWMSKDADIVYTSIEVDGYFQHDHIPLYTIPPRKAGEK